MDIKKVIKNKYTLWVAIAIILIIVAYVVYKRMNASTQYDLLMKAIDSDKNITGDATKDAEKEDAWSETWWRNVANRKELDANTATSMSSIIYSSKGYTMDDEPKAMEQFKRLTHKAEVSKLADVFKGKYGVRLIDFIDFMDKQGSSKQDVINYVKNLPK